MENFVLKERVPPSNASSLVRQIVLFVLRNELKVTSFQISKLLRINEHSKKPVISSKGSAVVSVTSYGSRLDTVHLVLESIASGFVLPSRLILWVDTEEAYSRPSLQLKRLMERGVELRRCDNFGPHTKYYPYLLSTEAFHLPLVTADDDQLYPRWWLEGLLHAFEEHPKCVSCYRAHCVEMDNNVMASYESWRPCRTTSASFLHFATGVSGVIYPPSFLQHLKAAGAGFLSLCPKADDAWLHVQSLRAGMQVRQVYDRPLRFPAIPGSQASGLFHTNVLRAQNNCQIGHTYLPSDLALLHACAAQTK
jgi:hypothetical protein